MTVRDSDAARRRAARVWPPDLATVEQRVARVVELLMSGVSRAEVARRLGVTQASVTRYINIYEFGSRTIPISGNPDIGYEIETPKRVVRVRWLRTFAPADSN